MCVRPKFIFLSTVIQGLSSLGQNIDVCLRPLIDELMQLWSSGALTYDRYIEEIKFYCEGDFDMDY